MTTPALSTTIHRFGGILVAPGFTDPVKFIDGNPYGTSHVDAQGTIPISDVPRSAAKVQDERVVKVASLVKGE